MWTTPEAQRASARFGCPDFPLTRIECSYFSSRTSFSLALLISSIFLISSSVSFWISSSDRFSSSSVLFEHFVQMLHHFLAAFLRKRWHRHSDQLAVVHGIEP